MNLIWNQDPHLGGTTDWDYLEVLGEWLALAALLAVALLVTSRLLARQASPPAASAGGRELRPWPDLAWCLLLFGIAAWLRMNQILVEPLEMQEASELYPVFQEGWDWLRVIFVPNKGEPHQFLLPLFLYPFRDEVADVRTLRYLPAAFGALVPVLTYLVTRSLRLPMAESVVIALATAVSPFHVYFSRLMLPYVLANVFFLSMVLGAIDYGGAGAPLRRARVLFVAGALLAMSTHYATIPFGLLLVGGVLLAARSRRNRLLLLRDTLLAAVLFLPFAGRSLVYVLQPNSLNPHQWMIQLQMYVDRPLLPAMLRYVRYAMSSVYGLIDVDTSDPVRTLVAVAFAATFCAGCVALFRRSRLQGAALVVPALFFLLFLTILGPAGIYIKQQGIYFPPRRLVMLYPFVLVVGVAGLFALTSLARRARWLLRAAVVAPALAAWWLGAAAMHSRASLPDGAEVGRILRQELRDGDGLLIGPATWMRWIVLTGLLEREDPRWISLMDTADFFELSLERSPFPVDAPAPGMLFNMPETFALAETHLQRVRLKRVWVVHIWQDTAGWPEIVRDHDRQVTFRRHLERHFEPVKTYALRSIELTAWDRVSRVPPPSEGYEVELGRLGHPFVSLTWPPPPVPTFGDHERHFLGGGRLDLPLPGPGEWTVEIEARFEGETGLTAASFLWGDGEDAYRMQHAMLGGEWSWLRYAATAGESAPMPSFVWEFRPFGTERPMATDTWAHIKRAFEQTLWRQPLQVRRVRVSPSPRPRPYAGRSSGQRLP